MARRDDERQPLLQNGHHQSPRNSSHDRQRRDDGQDQSQDRKQKVEFDDGDPEDPRNWSRTAKYLQTLQIFAIAFVCPMASSILTPALDDITRDLSTTKQVGLLAQAGFVCMLGIGPLIHAPMSETFGRRRTFLVNLVLFVLLQIPAALAPNIESFIVVRALAGFFGSVGVANGGGSISDLFETEERAPVLGIYLVAPLLGPTIGPLLGGVIVGNVHWRWIFWIVFIAAAVITISAFFFLHETRAITLLQWRQSKLEKKNPESEYTVDGASDSSLLTKIGQNGTRAVRILTTQPIVMTMSLYQALVFSSMYSLFAQWTSVWNQPAYDFTVTQIGLFYLAPASGFILTSFILVNFIDPVYQYQCDRFDTDGVPEYRLPLANIGAFLLPISLFWFGWAAQAQLHWAVLIGATFLFGASQVSIFNTVQTYYIDSFEKNAASALAAGAFLRSLVGGIVPVFVGAMFEKLGYGWGMSVFGFLSLALMPAPLLFYFYGRQLREKFPFNG